MEKIRDLEDLENIDEDEFIKIANNFKFSKTVIVKHLSDYAKENP